MLGEVEQVNLERIQHALPRNNDLLRLLFNRQRPDEGSHFLSSLPLRQLSKTFLTSPDARVDDLQEELPEARVENEDSAV